MKTLWISVDLQRNQQLYLQKSYGCTPASCFLLFPSLSLLPFPCSPPILPCSQHPSFIPAASKAFCEQPLRRHPLPTAAQTRCLRIKSYHVINSDSRSDFLSRLTTCFLFGWAVPSGSCKKLQAVKPLCVVPSASGKDLLELSSLPNAWTVLPRNTLSNSALTSHCWIISRH